MRAVSLAAVASVAALVAPGAAAPSIVIRHDRDPARYAVTGDRFAAVGRLAGQVECALVHPRWVLTAAHTIESSLPFGTLEVELAGKRYEVEKGVLLPGRVRGATDPTHDMALLKLSAPVTGVRPLPLYDRSDELGRTLVLVGRGMTGTGRTGPAGERDGVLRAATNRVDAVTAATIEVTFDEPPGGTDLEGVGGAGDSGGPGLIERGGRLYVAGVASTNSGSADDGTAGKYGTVDAYARVSTRRAWIAATIADDPPTMLWAPLTKARDDSGLPSTPAARVASAFLAAFNAADEPALKAFFRDHTRPGTDAELADAAREYAGLSRGYGGYELFGFRAQGPYRIGLFVRAKKTGAWRGVLLALNEKDPARASQLAMGDISAPAGAETP